MQPSTNATIHHHHLHHLPHEKITHTYAHQLTTFHILSLCLIKEGMTAVAPARTTSESFAAKSTSLWPNIAGVVHVVDRMHNTGVSFSCTPDLSHSNCSLIHVLTHSLAICASNYTHSLTHSFTRSLTHPPSYSLIHSLSTQLRLLTHAPTLHSVVHSLTTHSPTCTHST
jgi:hypothetical protein